MEAGRICADVLAPFTSGLLNGRAGSARPVRALFQLWPEAFPGRASEAGQVSVHIEGGRVCVPRRTLLRHTLLFFFPDFHYVLLKINRFEALEDFIYGNRSGMIWEWFLIYWKSIRDHFWAKTRPYL